MEQRNSIRIFARCDRRFVVIVGVARCEGVSFDGRPFIPEYSAQ